MSNFGEGKGREGKRRGGHKPHNFTFGSFRCASKQNVFKDEETGGRKYVTLICTYICVIMLHIYVIDLN
jgi:hypothetical protein